MISINMRTTIDIDEDVLEGAKAIAANRGISTGRVISELARAALTPRRRFRRVRNGVPLFPPRKGARLVTPELVNRLRDED
jgi:hypothetical protein